MVLICANGARLVRVSCEFTRGCVQVRKPGSRSCDGGKKQIYNCWTLTSVCFQSGFLWHKIFSEDLVSHLGKIGLFFSHLWIIYFMGRFRKRNSDRPFYFKWKAANVPRSLMDLCDSRIYQFLDTHQNLEVPFASYKASPVNFSPFDIFSTGNRKKRSSLYSHLFSFQEIGGPNSVRDQ